MADLRKRCPECKRQFRPRKGTRRQYCETCRPPRLAPIAETAPAGGVDEGPGPLELVMAAELERVDRVATVEGQAALACARDADRLAGTPQRAGVLEKLLRLKAAALVGTKGVPDRLDDVARRRAEKAAAAS